MNKRFVSVISLALVLTLFMLAGAVPASAVESVFVPSPSYAESDFYRRLLEVELTGDPRQDIVSIALSQEGYIEGGMEGDNGGNGRVCNNYCEYGHAMGNNGTIWCTSFIWWCARQAGLGKSVFPDTIWPRLLTVNCPYVGYTSTASIQPGDILFVENSGDDTSDHLALVVDVSDTHITAIEGNCGNRVCRISYERDIGARADGMGTILYIGYLNYSNDPSIPDATSLEQWALITEDAALFNKHTGGRNQGTVLKGDQYPLLAVRGDGKWCQIELDGLAYWIDASCAFTGTKSEVVDKFFEIAGEHYTLPSRTTVPTLDAAQEIPEAVATETTTTAASTTTAATTKNDAQVLPESENPQHSDSARTEAIILTVLAVLVMVVLVALIYYIKKVNREW